MAGADINTWGFRNYYAGKSAENTKYYVILVAGEHLPHAVVRVTGTVEEAFTHSLRWEPADLLSRVDGEPRWTVREADIGYANGFLVEMVKFLREAWFCSELAQFNYYAVFRDADLCHDTMDGFDITKAHMLVRVADADTAQMYDGDNMWHPTAKLDRILSGEDSDEEFIAVGPDEVRQLIQKHDRFWAEQWEHQVLLIGDVVGAVIRTATMPSGVRREAAFTGGGDLEESDLLSQAASEPTWQVPLIEWTQSVEIMAALTRARRTSNTGGYALFHRPNDVLDLESAYAVVPEPPAGEVISARLTPAETDHLARLHFLWNVRRAAAPLGEHHYFAVFGSAADLPDLAKAFSVIRCPATAPRTWQVLVRPGEWLPRLGPMGQHTLPLTAEGAEWLCHRLTTGETRFFQIRSPEVAGPVAVLGVTGTSEKAYRDGAWVDSDFLSLLPHESNWFVFEQPVRAAERS